MFHGSSATETKGFRFQLTGIPVSVKPEFFFGSAIMGLGGTAADLARWVAICFVSILVHELGHAFAVRRYGGSPRVVLHAAGGYTTWDAGEGVTLPRHHLLVSAAGPAAQLLFAAMIVALHHVPLAEGWDADLYDDLLFVNFGWALFNLVPMLPLDGGQALQSLLAIRSPDRAPVIAESVTLVSSGAVLAGAFATGWLWPGIIAAYCLVAAAASLRRRYEGSVDVAFAERMTDLRRHRAYGDLAAVDSLGAELLLAARTSKLRRDIAREVVLARFEAGESAAAIELIRTHFRGGETPTEVWLIQVLAKDGARGALARIEAEAILTDSIDVIGLYVGVSCELGALDRCAEILRARPDIVAFAGVSDRAASQFYRRRFQEALDACDVGLLVWNAPTFAYNAACCLAGLERLDDGFLELDRAVDLRFDKPLMFDDDPDLAAYRDDPRWAEFQAKRARSAEDGSNDAEVPITDPSV